MNAVLLPGRLDITGENVQEKAEPASVEHALKPEAPESKDASILKKQTMKYPDLGACNDDNHKQPCPKMLWLKRIW